MVMRPPWATPAKHFRIVEGFADYQFFRAGGLLIGTHAFLALGNQLGVAWGSVTRTLDLDFAHAGSGQAVMLDRGDACLVNLPDPARYGLHKLLVASQRGARHPKYNKDILQALALIEWHLERAPALLKDAWTDLAERGKGWEQRARASFKAAPAAQRALVARFIERVGFESAARNE